MRPISVSCLAITLVLTACLGSDFADSLEGSWTLTSGTFDGDPLILQEAHPVTMTLDDGQISGTAACNGYGGQYRVSGSDFEIPQGLAVTEMACSPQGMMETERRFLDALLATNTVALEDGRLRLSGHGVELEFVLSAEGSSDEVFVMLLGPETFGSWQLVSGTLDGVAIPLVESHPVTLEVVAGEVGGTAACNHYGVVFVANGPTEMSMTAMACEPEVMRSETAYMTAISRADDAFVEVERLVVTGDGVELTFTRLDSVPVADLVGTTWVLESLVRGDSVSSVAGDRATLVLHDDGTFEGSTGCRSIGGRYQVSAAEVILTSWGAEGDCATSLRSGQPGGDGARRRLSHRRGGRPTHPLVQGRRGPRLPSR
jgi:heat shock protein HslJ